MKTRAILLVFTLFLSATSPRANAADNGPFAPEMACVSALRGFATTSLARQPGLPTSAMTPISNDAGTAAPAMIGIEEKSKDGKFLTLHFFNSTGEFTALIPYPSNELTKTCIDGISFGGSKSALVYENWGPATAGESRLGTLTPLRNGANCSTAMGAPKTKGDEPITAHQSGAAQGATAKMLLDSELAILINSVHANWSQNTAIAHRRQNSPLHTPRIPESAYDPKTGHLSAAANLGALEQCRLALSEGPEFSALRAAISRESGKFEAKTPLAPGPAANPPAAGASAN